MSKYTTEIRYMCEVYAGESESKGFDSIEDKIISGNLVPGILTLAAPNIFDFDFPIFDEDYRLPLEKKILRHYYTREIGSETVGLFKLRLCDRLNMIMPYYNKLYESELIKFNPMWDVDKTTEHSGIAANSESESKNENRTNISNGVSNQSQSDNKTEKGNNLRNDSENSNTSYDSLGNKTHINQEINNKNINNTGKTTENSNNISSGVNSINSNNKEDGINTKNENGIDKYADTPQGSITNLLQDKYLTNARNIIGSTIDTNAKSGNSNINENNSQINNGTNDINETKNTNENSTGINNGQEHTSKNDTQSSNKNTIGTETYDKINSETGNVNKNVSETTNNNFNGVRENKSATTENYIERIAGKTSGYTYSRMLMEFRESFINIDKMIIDNLNDLFFGLW